MAKILVCDDDLGANVMIAKALTLDGHVARTAFNGEEALKRFAAERFDLLIIDVFMPKMSGAELVARLRAQGALDDVPVILCSGRDERELNRIAEEVGAADAIAKPLELADLRARVRRALEKKRAGHSAVHAPAAPAPHDPVAELPTLDVVLAPDDLDQSRRTAAPPPPAPPASAPAPGQADCSGRLDPMLPGELVRLMFLGKKSGIVEVVRPDLRGEIAFQMGEIVRASVRGLDGREIQRSLVAVKTICGWRAGSFRIAFRDAAPGGGSIMKTTAALLAELLPPGV